LRKKECARKKEKKTQADVSTVVFVPLVVDRLTDTLPFIFINASPQNTTINSKQQTIKAMNRAKKREKERERERMSRPSLLC